MTGKSTCSNDLPTLEYLRANLTYSPTTGEFFWVKPQSNFHKGGKAGSVDRLGYVFIMIKKRRYLAHRLAFVMMTGRWPVHEVDHINGVPSDNRWSNLRPATRSQNGSNTAMSPRNASGFKGVFYHKHRRKWLASIGVKGRAKYLGYFERPEDAHLAYLRASEKYHGEYKSRNSGGIFA